MSYKPSSSTSRLLDKALFYVSSVPYTVTARWLFYRLLQDGSLSQKSDYKRLLSYLSHARKEFWGGWTPFTLADDTRAARIRGDDGFGSPQGWLDAVVRHAHCELDRWNDQPSYVECWFEAAAMMAQFEHYSPDIVPLLAFHGDISIPEKWKAAERLMNRWLAYRKPIVILYYGDLDPKGIQIPQTAEHDIRVFAAYALYRSLPNGGISRSDLVREFQKEFEFIRVGLLDSHIAEFDIPENPERPGTYQWEGLADDAAAGLIGVADTYIDYVVNEKVVAREDDATTSFSDFLSQLYLD